MELSMSSIMGTQHVLAVNDLKQSVDFYVNKLGFEVLNEFPGWSFLGRESFKIMLGECIDTIPAEQTGDHSYFAYVYVSNASALNKEFKNSNIEFVKNISDEPWGMREFGVKTIDGHRIMFGEEIVD